MNQPTRLEIPKPNLADDRVRFQVELEFVQCLANPHYLNFLAQKGYFKEPNFVNYLKYLLYWKKPEYVKHIKYPHCMSMLELLQHEQFRVELANSPSVKFIENQLLLHWKHYIKNRTQEDEMELLPSQVDLQMPSTSEALRRSLACSKRPCSEA
ncbi:mediator of RNA polymerase II transcription subunit 31-like [Clavelina lepadiformis]|uniref:Mediator of RNA polymerase II transcription subunit 31 n=1 Tax=Clavelina lepadiformis TaxID=159417 RepID=A0ABP0FR71_CLALP